MCLWGGFRQVLGIHGVLEGDRSKPRESTGHHRYGFAQDHQRRLEAHRKDCSSNRFVSRATDKCLPFFKTLKRAFTWTKECEAAFQELKRYLSNPPLLSPSKEGESLQLYLAVSATVVSAALIREEGKKQLPVYYVSQAFQGAESSYLRIEKIAFALIVASRKIRQYFQENPI